MHRTTARFVALLLPLVAVLSAQTAPVHAQRTASIWLQAVDPTPGTLTATNVQVMLSAADYQNPQPTGSATVTDNGHTIGTASPGFCRGTPCLTFKYTFEAGDHTLVASYAGDSQFAPATSDPVAFTLGRYPLTGTTTSSGTTPPGGAVPEVTAGEPVTFTAKFAITGGAPMVPLAGSPTGTVTFVDEQDNERVVGTAPMKNWTATLTTTLPLGPHTSGNTKGLHGVWGTYAGDTNFSPVSGIPGLIALRVVEASSSSDPTPTAPTSPSSRTTRTTAASSNHAAAGDQVTATMKASTSEHPLDAVAEGGSEPDQHALSASPKVTLNVKSGDDGSPPIALGMTAAGAIAAAGWALVRFGWRARSRPST